MITTSHLRFGHWEFPWDLGIGIWSFAKSKITRLILTVATMLVVTAQAEELPRKAKMPAQHHHQAA